MTKEEIIHVYENSRLQSDNFTPDAVTAAYVSGLSALHEKAEREANNPLALDELQEMDFGEWVWVQNLHTERDDIVSGYYRKMDGYRLEDAFYFGYPEYEKIGHTAWGKYADYGKTWTAYRSKPEEGTK